jgi:hypothetical protein
MPAWWRYAIWCPFKRSQDRLGVSQTHVQIWTFKWYIWSSTFKKAMLYKTTTSYPCLISPQRRSLAMATVKAMSNHSSTRKLTRQKQCRRRSNMMKKAYEYSKLCNADVCMGIRMRETGQVHVVSRSIGLLGFSYDTYRDVIWRNANQIRNATIRLQLW